MATVAVVIAIGGGIAIAGKNDKGAKPVVSRTASLHLDSGVEGGVQKTLLNVPGVGKFTASRAQSAPSGGITYKNTTNAVLTLSWLVGLTQSSEELNTFSDFIELQPGEEKSFGSAGTRQLYDLFIHPASDNRDLPSADVAMDFIVGSYWISVSTPKG